MIAGRTARGEKKMRKKINEDVNPPPDKNVLEEAFNNTRN
jgi:hypothetical protein